MKSTAPMANKILVLTDHSKHNEANSIYGILSELSRRPEVEIIDIASRKISQNSDFFNGINFEKLYATGHDSEFAFYDDGRAYEKLNKVNPEKYDVVFLRLPRPVTDDYLMQLKRAFPKKKFINDPEGIVNTSNKRFILNFPKLTTNIKLIRNLRDLQDFKTIGAVVLKPLREYGGKGILKIDGGSISEGQHEISQEELEKRLEQEEYLGMKFLKNVVNGDKRIIVVNGEIIAASLRKPGPNQWLCNVAQGGSSELSEPTPEEINIVNVIAPVLSQHGIVYFGLDTLEDDDGKRILSEINTLSIGGIVPASLETEDPVLENFVNGLVKFMEYEN